MSERFELLDQGFEEEFYCRVGYFIDNKTGNTGDFEPYPYVLSYIKLLNELQCENERLKQENNQLNIEQKRVDEIFEKLLVFLDKCNLTDNQRDLFKQIVMEGDDD